ncbi:RNA endoribonuclease [Entomortierella beljakovae]|nr:RNA endoribonuclease [Entomortierella beljakovae]
MTTELQSLQHRHELERHAQITEQRLEQDQLLQTQQAQFQEKQEEYFRLQNEFHQEPTPQREHELLMLDQGGHHAQEMFTQQQQHLLERHHQDQLRLQERQWHQQQLLFQKHQPQLHQLSPFSGSSLMNNTANSHQYPQQQPSNGHSQHQHPIHQLAQPYEDTAEAMDVDDEEQLLSIASTITNFRQHSSTTTDTSAINSWASGPVSSQPTNSKDPDAIVVFDTNVLISHLNFMKSFIQMYGKKDTDSSTNATTFKGDNIIFVIPWIVVQELDGLKSGGGRGGEVDLRFKAQRAIQYIQSELLRPEETRRLRGQKLSENLEVHKTNDDKILDCCLYFRKLYPKESTKVTMFSNDRNLCVKALIHDIKTISRDKIEFEPTVVYAAIISVDQANLMEQDEMVLDMDCEINVDLKAPKKRMSYSSKSKGGYRTEMNDRELSRIKSNSMVITAPEGMDPMLFDLTNHIVKNLRRYFEFVVPDHLKAFYGAEWKTITEYEKTRTKDEDLAYDCRRLSQPLYLLQNNWLVFADHFGDYDKSDQSNSRLTRMQVFIKSWDRVQTFGLGKVYKKDLKVFLEDVEDILTGITKTPKPRKSSSIKNDALVPTCIIIFSSLAFISAECGKQDRRRHFNQFSSEVVVQGESQVELDADESSSSRLLKPRRTFSLALLRCLGAIAQIGLYAYLAFEKLSDQNQVAPILPPNDLESTFEYNFHAQGTNDEWPLWLPVMHGIVWVYATILSIVSLLHPRLSNPYRLTTHLDIIYLATAGAGLAHFMVYNFGRPLGLWTLDDQISGLSGLISGSMLILTLATKPLVPPQPIKGPDRKSRGLISPETRSSIYARVAFTWLHPMVIKSLRGKLQETDVWAMDRALRIKTVFQDYLENRRPTVFVTMLQLFRFELTQQLIWALAWAGLGMVPPFVVYKLISFSQDLSSYNRNEAMFYVASLLASIVTRSAGKDHELEATDEYL